MRGSAASEQGLLRISSAACAVALVLSGCSATGDQKTAAHDQPSVRATAAAPEPPVVDASTWFVSPDGDDDDDGSRASPWRTLQHALEQLRRGDTLQVRGGTYDEDVEPQLQPATPEERITVRAYEGEQAVVKGLVRLDEPDYWTVQDLEFTWGGGSFDDHMVKVSGGRGWVLERLRIHGSRSRAGLLIAKSVDGGAPQDYVLRDSAVYDSKKGANLYLNPGLDSRGGLIERNLFFDSPTENVKVGFGGSCDELDDDLFGARDVVVRHNTMSDANQPLTIAEPASDIEVYGNIVTSSRREALVRLDGQCSELGEDIRLYDNLGADADRWCREADSNVTCDEADAGGNLFPVDPDFDDEDVDGFRPQDPVARGYGRYAPK